MVFRHSESYDNLYGLFSGWRNPDLTLKGINQAEKIAEQLKDFQIDYAFTSHLYRARKTLDIVLSKHPLTTVFVDDRIIERCYGFLQGKSKTIKQVNLEWYTRIHKSYNFSPPDGESFAMVEKRVGSFLNQLAKWLESCPGNVAISCHGNSIKPIMRFFEHLSIDQMLNLKTPQERVLVYDLDVLSLKEIGEEIKPFWKGVIVPQEVKVASDLMNPLNIYY